jgi:TolB protein
MQSTWLAPVLASLLVAVPLPATKNAPKGQRLLAVASSHTGNSEIFLVNPDSGDVRNLTNHSAADMEPAWSPDGKLIAFISDRDGTPNLFVMNEEGADLRQLTREKSPCSWPRWAPDSQKIVFVGHRGNLDQICVVDVRAAKVEQLTNAPVASRHPSWSPDGKKLIFSHYINTGPYETYIMNADGTGQANLSRGGGLDAVWSPDGKRVAFTSVRAAGGFRLYVMDADGGNVKELSSTDNGIGNVYPCWSPDSKKVAFTDLDGGVLQIAVVGFDGTGYKVLTAKGSNAFAKWSADGTRIAFSRQEEGQPAALWICDPDGNNARELLRGYGSCAWKPR